MQLSAEQAAAIAEACAVLSAQSGNGHRVGVRLRLAFLVAPAATPERERHWDCGQCHYQNKPGDRACYRCWQPAPAPERAPDKCSCQGCTFGGSCVIPLLPTPAWLGEPTDDDPATAPVPPVLEDERATWIEYVALLVEGYERAARLLVGHRYPYLTAAARDRLLALRAKLGISGRHEDLRAPTPEPPSLYTGSPTCPDGRLPDGPRCPACGVERWTIGGAGVDPMQSGYPWFHRTAGALTPDRFIAAVEYRNRCHQERIAVEAASVGGPHDTTACGLD